MYYFAKKSIICFTHCMTIEKKNKIFVNAVLYNKNKNLHLLQYFKK